MQAHSLAVAWMGKMSDGRLKDQVLELVTKLPPSSVSEVYRQIRRSGDASAEKVDLVRQAVVQYLNTSRPHRAQRLFTELFAPFLVSDPVLLRASSWIPGVIQRLDLACVWAVLGRQAFRTLTAETQRALDRLVGDQMMDEVFQSAEALALQNRMRLAAIRYLDEICVTPEAFDGFLAGFNRIRHVEARKSLPAITEIANDDHGFVETIRDILVYRKMFEPYLNATLNGLRDGPRSDLEASRRADALVAQVEELRAMLEGSGRRTRFHLMLALSVINVGRRYDVAALYLRRIDGESEEAVAVTAAMVGHYLACCQAIIEFLTAALRITERLADESLQFGEERRHELEAALGRLTDLVQAVAACGLCEDPRTQEMIRLAWERLSTFIAKRVAPLAMRRASAAMSARQQGADDHDEVAWLLDFLARWLQLLRLRGDAPGSLADLPVGFGQDLRLAVQQAIRVEPKEPLEGRLAHLLRLDRLAAPFRYRLAPLLSLSSQNVVKILMDRLGRPAPLEGRERVLISEVVDAARKDVDRSRNWKSPELVDLIEAADTRGLRDRADGQGALA
ncbi:MAG: hypothetical protein GC191_02045 [Azospirillum sp.]|nr:hypothetical protein [Azospirillum sp.]